MKFLAIIVGAVVSSSAVAGPTNLLQNGDLELFSPSPNPFNNADGWTLVTPEVDGAGETVLSASFASFGNHTPGGDRGLWLRSFEGGLGGEEPFTVNATVFQDVAAHAGVEYEVSAWFEFEANYTSAMTFLSLQFFDAAMTELSVHSIDINSLNAFDGVWREFSVAAVADAGTAFVRVSAGMIDGQISPINPQSAFIDDFVLIPAPGSAALLVVAAGGAMARRRRSSC